jgi:hypothetical protein
MAGSGVAAMTAVNMSSSHNASARLELRERELALPISGATCRFRANQAGGGPSTAIITVP